MSPLGQKVGDKILYDSQCNPFGMYMERSLVLEQLGYDKDLKDVND